MWISWLEHSPIHQEVGGLISGQGTYICCRFPLVGIRMGGNQSMFLSHQCFSLFLSLLPSLKSINIFFKRYMWRQGVVILRFSLKVQRDSAEASLVLMSLRKKQIIFLSTYCVPGIVLSTKHFAYILLLIFTNRHYRKEFKFI